MGRTRRGAKNISVGCIEAGDKVVYKDDLNESLSKIGLKISVPALADVPKSLQDSWDLITEEKKGYHFKVELLRRLVAKYKPLHSVKNELNRLEPEANNYYQIDVVNVSTNSDFTPVITNVYAANGEIAFSEDALNSLIVPSATADYFIEVSSLDSNTGSYEVSVSQPEDIQADKNTSGVLVLIKPPEE